MQIEAIVDVDTFVRRPAGSINACNWNRAELLAATGTADENTQL
jgi:hypothetical protein